MGGSVADVGGGVGCVRAHNASWQRLKRGRGGARRIRAQWLLHSNTRTMLGAERDSWGGEMRCDSPHSAFGACHANDGDCAVEGRKLQILFDDQSGRRTINAQLKNLTHFRHTTHLCGYSCRYASRMMQIDWRAEKRAASMLSCACYFECQSSRHYMLATPLPLPARCPHFANPDTSPQYRTHRCDAMRCDGNEDSLLYRHGQTHRKLIGTVIMRWCDDAPFDRGGPRWRLVPHIPPQGRANCQKSIHRPSCTHVRDLQRRGRVVESARIMVPSPCVRIT